MGKGKRGVKMWQPRRWIPAKIPADEANQELLPLHHSRVYAQKRFDAQARRRESRVLSLRGRLNISLPWQIHAQEETAIISWRECSKKSVQQGRSHFDARSVHGVREHGKMARTPLAAFFNIPLRIDTRLKPR
jgi:hypothetical protein